MRIWPDTIGHSMHGSRNEKMGTVKLQCEACTGAKTFKPNKHTNEDMNIWMRIVINPKRNSFIQHYSFVNNNVLL